MNFFTKLAELARTIFQVESISDASETARKEAKETKREELSRKPTSVAEAMGGTSAPPPQHAFAPQELLTNLPNMKQSQLDMLDFGCIRVSDEGKILSYNRWQSEFAQVNQDEALGKNFFRELAPCTNNRLVFGRFKQGVADGSLDVVVSYAFTYRMRPTLVKVHLYREPKTRSNWVLVARVGGNK
jgi:photoactive yellow protein